MSACRARRLCQNRVSQAEGRIIREPFSEDLLVSSPNGGGISLVSGASVLILDGIDCTGLWVEGETLFRNAILESPDTKRMELEAYSGDGGRRVLAVDPGYDFHDVLVHEGRVYLVSTGTNEILVLSPDGRVVARHAYPGGNDSWHLNCLAVWDGRVVVSAFGEFDAYRGYKHNTRGRGFVMDLETGAKLWEGLSQPHTPVQRGDLRFVCNSEEKQVLARDASGGIRRLQFDAYTRGLAFGEQHLYVGLSQSRNIEAAGARGGRIVAVDPSTFALCGERTIPFAEIYDLRVLARGSRLPLVFMSQAIAGLRAECRQRSRELVEARRELATLHAQFRRVNDHAVAGPLLRLLRWVKADRTFGNPEVGPQPPAADA